MGPLRSRVAELRGDAVDLGFAAGWSTLKAVPAPLAGQAFQAAADSALVRNGPQVQQLRANLRRVLGSAASDRQLTALTRDSLRSYARYWLETFRLPKMNKRKVVAAVGRNTVGAHHLDAAVEAGRGYVVALPHMGNWDVAGLWVVDRYRKPFSTVAERLRPESLFDRFVAYRQSLGMQVIPLTGGERPPTAILTERLEAGGGVCLVADRDLSRNGIDVDFFGEPTKMPGGPALLAATTGAALLPVGLWFTDDGGWGQQICAPIQLPEGRLADKVRIGTQLLADAFAAQIRAHPAHWHMLQRLWLADLPPRPTRD